MPDKNSTESKVLQSVAPSSHEYDFIDDEIETPPFPPGGHCLFTVGAVSAGKSTFQHSLIHRLHTDQRIDLTVRNEDGEPYPNQELQDWIFRFDRGEFPNSTQTNLLQTFYIDFGIEKHSAKLSFVEISGEHFQRILPQSGDIDYEPQLNAALENILTTGNVKKLFVFVADSTRHESKYSTPVSEDERNHPLYEDMMFSCLLDRFKNLGLERIKVLFVASKWDAVSFTNVSAQQFFRIHFPRTQATLRKFSYIQVDYLKFSVGKVEEKRKSGNNKTMERKIVTHNYSQIDKAIHWIYFQAKDRKLKGYPPIRLTLWEKIKNWAAS